MTNPKVEYEVYRAQFIAALETEFKALQDLSHPRATSERADFMQWARKRLTDDNAHSRGMRRCWECNAPVNAAAEAYLDVVLAPTSHQIMALSDLLGALSQRPN